MLEEVSDADSRRTEGTGGIHSGMEEVTWERWIREGGAHARGGFLDRSNPPDERRNFREEELMGKRKAMDAEFRAGILRRRVNQDQGSFQTSIHDRLGPSRQREDLEQGKGGAADSSRVGFKPKDADICFWCC